MSEVEQAQPSYLDRWRLLSRSARLYLIHVALLTSSLAISNLFFNLAILALGYERSFLGLLHSFSVFIALIVSLPLWWLAVRIGLRQALLAGAAFQACSTLALALWPRPGPLLVATALTGMAAVLFQVSSAPFMMRHSDETARDHLFSASAAINIGLAGVGSLVAGSLPALFASALHVAPESALAYRASFAVAGAGLMLSLLPLLLIPRGARREAAPASSAQPPATPRPRRSLSTMRLRQLPEPWRTLIRRPWPLLRLLIPPFCISWGAALLIPYVNLFFKERFAIDDSLLGLIFAGLGICTGLAALGAPVLSARIGKVKTIILTQALSLPFLLAVGFVPLLGVAVGAALARTALFNMGTPLYDAFAMEQSEERVRPVAIGLINGAYSSAYVIAPRISAEVQERYGFEPLFIATAGFYLLAILATYMLFGRTPRRQSLADGAQRSGGA